MLASQRDSRVEVGAGCKILFKDFATGRRWCGYRTPTMWAIGRFAIGYRFPISVARYPHTLRCVGGADAEVREDIGNDLVALQRVEREARERDLTTMKSHVLVPECGSRPIAFE